MKSKWRVYAYLTLVMAAPAWGAEAYGVEDLALCRDSWLDWKSTDPSKIATFGAFLRSEFVRNENDASVIPKSVMTINGLKVTRVYPESIGMGVGFSMLVDASFDVTREAFERELGRSLRDCGTSDGMRTCELPIAQRRTLMLVSSDPPNHDGTLVGCYYFYEK